MTTSNHLSMLDADQRYLHACARAPPPRLSMSNGKLLVQDRIHICEAQECMLVGRPLADHAQIAAGVEVRVGPPLFAMLR